MLPLRFRVSIALLPLLALLMLVSPAFAQSTESGILTRFQGQSLFLRGFYIDDKLKFDTAGKPEKDYKTGSFTVCGFRADHVEISGDHLRIGGVRLGLSFDKDGTPRSAVMTVGKFVTKDEAVSIEIDNHGQTDFTRALDKVFANGFQELASSLPDFWQPYLLRQRTGESLHCRGPRSACTLAEPPATTRKSPVDQSSSGPGEKPEHVGGAVKPPRLLHAPDPKFSDAARRNRFSGNVEVYLVVGTDGLPTQIEIVRPVGLGLDEMAAAAVSGYTFSPATRDGQPVKVDLYVEVNFQIY